MKTYLITDNDGKVLSVLNTSDPDIILPEENIVEITKHKDKEKILENPKHFKVKSKKPSELSAAEKAKVDEVEKPPTNPIMEMLLDIIKRVEDLEKKSKK